MSAKYVHNIFTDNRGKIKVSDLKTILKHLIDKRMLDSGSEQYVNLYNLPYKNNDEVVLITLEEFLNNKEYDELDEFKFLISSDKSEMVANVFPLQNFEEGAKQFLEYTLYVASSKFFLAPEPLGPEGKLLSVSDGEEVSLNYEKAVLEDGRVMFYDAGFHPFKKEEFDGSVILQNMDGATGELEKKEFLPSKNGMKFELSRVTPKGSAASLSNDFKNIVKRAGLGDNLIEIPIWS
jgi:hypothetical protein